MQWLEDKINWLTDMDWQWFPYLSMRPEKHEKMTSISLLGLTALYSPFIVLVSALILIFDMRIYIAGMPLFLSTALVVFILQAIFFFLSMRLIVATAWNSRANHYEKQKRSQAQLLEEESESVDTDTLPLAANLTNPAKSAVAFISNRTE